MAQDLTFVNLTVTLEDRPGTLAEVGEALGKAGVNIHGMCGFPCEGKGVIHILIDNTGGWRHVLEGIGLKDSEEREVLVIEIEDRPGVLGDIARKIANAGANIELAYLATRTRLVIGVDDLEKARAAL